MFASLPATNRRVGELRVEARTVRFARLPARGDREPRFEREALAAATANGLATFATASSDAGDGRRDLLRGAVGRVEHEARPVDVDRHPFQAQRDAEDDLRDRVRPRFIGRDRQRAVSGSTAIRARTTTRPRLNGPATASVTIVSPNGAPS